MTNTTDRYATIAAAYEAALDRRDPATISITALLPTILDAVPDATDDEIEAALRWLGDQSMRKADALERFRNAKFGNEGKQGQPGDGTVPFRRAPNR